LLEPLPHLGEPVAGVAAPLRIQRDVGVVLRFVGLDELVLGQHAVVVLVPHADGAVEEPLLIVADFVGGQFAVGVLVELLEQLFGRRPAVLSGGH